MCCFCFVNPFLFTISIHYLFWFKMWLTLHCTPLSNEWCCLKLMNCLMGCNDLCFACWVVNRMHSLLCSAHCNHVPKSKFQVASMLHHCRLIHPILAGRWNGKASIWCLRQRRWQHVAKDELQAIRRRRQRWRDYTSTKLTLKSGKRASCWAAIGLCGQEPLHCMDGG